MPKKEKAISVVNNNPEKMSIFEVVGRLEKKDINPASLTKNMLRKCADVYKSRGYSNSQIAEILNVDDKTVQRYIKQQREENSLVISPDFQKKIVGEVVNNWKNQYQRLVKLSYSENLTPNEIMKAIYLAHQVEKDGVELLERLGYLRKEKLPEEAGRPSLIILHNFETDFNNWPAYQKLTEEQKQQISAMVNARKEMSLNINSLMKKYSGEEPFNIPGGPVRAEMQTCPIKPIK